jgi:hypothetical protein
VHKVGIQGRVFVSLNLSRKREMPGNRLSDCYMNVTCRWFGHGVSSVGTMIAMQNNAGVSAAAKKDALKVVSALHLSVAGLMAHGTYNDEIKKPMGIANTCYHLAIAAACAARGFRKEDKEE